LFSDSATASAYIEIASLIVCVILSSGNFPTISTIL
jgi:hypothetical protein